MKLYDAKTPNTLRVQVFLAEKGLEAPREPVDVAGGGTRTPKFLAKNSLGEVPLLELDDGRFLAESVAICRYVEARHPQPSLFGESPEEIGLIEMWNRRVEHHLFGAIGNVARHRFPFFADKVEQNEAFAAAEMRRFEKNWAWFDGELSDGRPFVAGDRFSVADVTGMAVIMVADMFEKASPAGLEHARRWEERMRARPSFGARLARAA